MPARDEPDAAGGRVWSAGADHASRRSGDDRSALQLGRGDFDAFFRAHFDGLVAYAARFGYDRVIAEDAALESMLDVFQRWDTLKEPIAFARHTARFRVVDAYRKHSSRSRELLVAEFPEELAAADFLLDSPDGLSGELLSALSSLPSQQRRMMFLLVSGAAISEIATCTGVSQQTVRSSIRKARGTLRRRLANHRLHG